jgi:anti-sigma regulatory factor (Ser/Thr protein kinase)
VSLHHVPVITFHLPAEPASVRRARRAVLAFAQEHSDDQDLHERVAIAVTEAFANAVLHAYDGGDERGRGVSVSADVEDDTLECVVADDGAGFRAASTQGALGAGLGIIAACADQFAIRERVPSGTEIWLRFDLG